MEPDTISDGMSTATTRIAYDGEAVRDGQMDVRDLAPALLELSALLERTNELLNGDRASVSVNVRADFKTGSFVIDLEIVQRVFEGVKDLLFGQSVQDAKYILELLGLSAGGGVLALYKWLRGKRAKAEQDGSVSITINNQTIVFPSQVIVIYNDTAVRDRFEGTLMPLTKEGIEEFQVRRGLGKETQIIERVTKVEALEAYETRREEESDAPEERPAHETTAEAAVIIVKPAFREGLKWELARDSKSAKFSAELKDEEFAERVRRREEKFAVGDVLVVDLRTRTFITPQGGVRTEHEIVKVKRKLEPPAQQPLFSEKG